MTSSEQTDPRWEGRVPWYLRHSGATVSGNVDTWLDLVGQRVERLFNFSEFGSFNDPHFGSCLETETLGRFKFTWGPPLGSQLKAYFAPDLVRRVAESDALGDPAEQLARELKRALQRPHRPGVALTLPAVSSPEASNAELRARLTREERVAAHWAKRVNERISALEAVIRLIAARGGPDSKPSLAALTADVRRFSAATHVPLDVEWGWPPLIRPLEEPLLQREVIDPLLTRLSARWPDRARELVTAYHDVVAGKPLDEIFSSAFKSVEEIARSLTGEQNFEFKDSELSRYFPSLHPTIRAGIVKLRAHRGDEAAHGRNAPEIGEIRYLLFQICNLALLLLDTQVTD